MIFVRLWQFRHGDGTQIVRQSGEGTALETRLSATCARLLFWNNSEELKIEDWQANAAVSVSNARGIEFIVLSGNVSANGVNLGPQRWTDCLRE